MSLSTGTGITTPNNGDIMAKVRLLKNRFTGPVVIKRGKNTYQISHAQDCEIPAALAAGLIGDSGLVIEFTKADEKAIKTFSGKTLEIMQKEFNVDGGAKKLASTMFPKLRKSKKAAPKKAAPKKVTPKKVVPKKEDEIDE